MKSKLDSIPLFNDVISIDKQHKKYRDRISGIVVRGSSKGERINWIQKGWTSPLLASPFVLNGCQKWCRLMAFKTTWSQQSKGGTNTMATSSIDGWSIVSMHATISLLANKLISPLKSTYTSITTNQIPISDVYTSLSNTQKLPQICLYLVFFVTKLFQVFLSKSSSLLIVLFLILTTSMLLQNN